MNPFLAAAAEVLLVVTIAVGVALVWSVGAALIVGGVLALAIVELYGVDDGEDQ